MFVGTDGIVWKKEATGRLHENGGGFVVNTAHVDPIAYVGENVQVSDNVRVFGRTQVIELFKNCKNALKKS